MSDTTVETGPEETIPPAAGPAESTEAADDEFAGDEDED